MRYCPIKRRENYEKRLKEKPLINIYDSMLARCYNKNHKNYKYYGAIGVKVCKRWLDSYVNFEKDMGKRPEGKTLDRINPEKGYSPSNCRWADSHTQAKNKKPYGKIKERYISKRNDKYKKKYRVKFKNFDRQFSTIEEAIEFRDLITGENNG